jgi:hypothetical protein
MDRSSAMNYVEVNEEILSSLDLQRLARKHRTKSDFHISYSLPEKDECQDLAGSTCDSDGVELESDDDSNDDSAFNEDGLSDSDFDESDEKVGCERQRLDTFDAYESEVAPPSPQRIVPTMSEQRPEMIPMLSGQGAVGLVTATPSHPIMIVCCGHAPQNVNVGMPYQPCASIREEIPAEALTPTCVEGCFIKREHASPISPPVPAAAPPMRPPGSLGTENPPSVGPRTIKSSNRLDLQHMKNHTKSEDERTTVMLRNLPSCFTRDKFVEWLDSLGFVAKYDFLHLPVDMARLSGLGFGFINFKTHRDALQFFEVAHGFQGWHRQSSKVLHVAWSNPLQGLAANIRKYRNSHIMHPSVPEQCRPMLFGKDGERVPFPCPTVAIRAPRGA